MVPSLSPIMRTGVQESSRSVGKPSSLPLLESHDKTRRKQPTLVTADVDLAVPESCVAFEIGRRRHPRKDRSLFPTRGGIVLERVRMDRVGISTDEMGTEQRTAIVVQVVRPRRVAITCRRENAVREWPLRLLHRQARAVDAARLRQCERI